MPMRFWVQWRWTIIMQWYEDVIGVLCTYTIQILMNALLAQQHVNPIPHVRTLLETTHVHATLDTKEMAVQQDAQVCVSSMVYIVLIVTSQTSMSAQQEQKRVRLILHV